MFNLGFFGKKGLKPFLGQVPGGQTDNMVNSGKWGDRVKVRIMGYHPKEGTSLADKDLPWAIVAKPTSQGNLNKGSISIGGGEWVTGYFLDDECQHPIITGILGRSNYSSEIGAEEQISKQSTEFQNINIFTSKNPAAPWNFVKGNMEGPPLGQQQPFTPPKNLFNA